MKNSSLNCVASLASQRGYHTLSCELWSLSEKEGACRAEANARTKWSEWSGRACQRGSAVSSVIRCALAETWNGRSEAWSGLLLGPAARAFLASKELSLSALF